MTSTSGNTLLMLAAYHGHLDTTQMLLGKGAAPNVLNDRGQSLIAGAVFYGHEEVVEALLDGGADIYLGYPNAIDCAVMFKRATIEARFAERLCASCRESGGGNGTKELKDAM